MISRLAAMVLLAGATRCVDDPRVDPCRDPSARPARCEAEEAGEPDAAQASDAGSDADARIDAQVDARIDAGPTKMDGSQPLDTGVRDARVPRDATSPNGQPQVVPLTGDLGVHDPAILETSGGFVIFATGPGIRVKRSYDLLTWMDEGHVFQANPDWIASAVPRASDLWAPDISYFGGKYHLYYSASSFGSRESCIGHATATDLSVLDFVDQGPVVCTTDADDYNAIDPALIIDEEGVAWLAFGSFWSGIKLIRLDADGARSGTELHALASRGDAEAIEAPFLVRRDGYYYLFVSFDYCCRGTASTYRIMVGRSETITGPYVDADGVAMAAGGGTSVVTGNQRWRGPGHNAVLETGSDSYLVYHTYDAQRNGAPTLRISDLFWSVDGWPVPVGP
jgi:arabinan endo-1,5-alpha-L-arabinosidase